MKTVGMKNLVLAVLLACFFLNGQQVCPGIQAGGVDTGNPKGTPLDDPTQPVIMERQLEEMQLQLPGMGQSGSTKHIGPQTDGGVESLAHGPGELGPKIISEV